MSLAKILVGLGVGGLIIGFLPFIDICEMFLYVVCVPIVFIACMGLVGEGAYESLQALPQWYLAFKGELLERVEGHRQNLAAPASPPSP